MGSFSRSRDAIAAASRGEVAALPRDYQMEITEAFHVFDHDKMGWMDVTTFTTLVRAFGFRVTTQDMERNIRECRIHHKVNNEPEERNLAVNLEMALDIISHNYADRGDSELDLLDTFALFDVDQTGFITLDNLREIGRELTLTGETIDTSDFQIQAMMNEFTEDGKISLDDFRRMLTGKRNIGISS
eukprot:CAMPEP_0198282744 /NCGR_PEP_ID=MMETSP1449-20131203/2512_1 /TAXON_ID=420275 /ORGANISM="Attheya septentrionalis, Strain CCMP2084" /LENGTH=186 /DNA_ID=CAMNT_0043979129 /DNA_START=134 /DNA_END=694 /DNA_ORIENTATION=+